MKKLLIISGLALIYVAHLAYADMDAPYVDTGSFPVTKWYSKNANDEVVIKNGTGDMLTIFISVDDSDANNQLSGISVDNCGTTQHVDAGSSAICSTVDATNPVTFSSDSTNPASGTYQIKRN
jgi:hypothetical protein